MSANPAPRVSWKLGDRRGAAAIQKPEYGEGPMATHEEGGDERFSFEAFTRHPFFTEVNRWIVERVICPGRRKIVDLGCGPGAVTKLILERLDDARNAKVIGIDPSPSALSKARAAIHSRVVEFIEGSAEWVSRLVSSADAVVFLNAIHLVPDKAQVLAEIRKVLKRDGVFAFNTTFFNGAYVDGTAGFLRPRGVRQERRTWLGWGPRAAYPLHQHDLQPPVRATQRGLNRLGRLAACEDESRVARTLGPGNQLLARMRGDGDVLDQRHLPSGIYSPHFP